MIEPALFVLGAIYLLAPIGLTVAVLLQGRRRRALEAEVAALAARVDRLARAQPRPATTAGAATAGASPEAAAGPALGAPSPPFVTLPPFAAARQPAAAPAWPPPPPPTSLVEPPPSVLDTSAEPVEPPPAILDTTAVPGDAAPPLPPPLVPPPAAGWSPPPPSAGWSPVPPAPAPPRAPFDWESLVGVRLFSWVAGLALLVAAVSFLRWSVENGWLGPAVRAALGAALGVGLLLGAETGRARRYPVTAQSLAGAAVAILFATVFAAHALWDLVGPVAAFALLALVTAVAVAYSVRRGALVVALLGLVGGFATPILLSTGEDRPIGLFSYLLLLDAGLAWVAWKRRWPLLGALSLGLTALYQLGWVVRFLDSGNLVVGAAVFLVFPAFGFLALGLSRRAVGPGEVPDAAPPLARWTAALGAIPPVLFALHAASRGDLAAHWPLLTAFAVLLAAGLLAVAALQGPEWLHLVGAGGAALTLVAILGGRHGRATWPGVLLPLAALTAVVLLGPRLLARRGRPLLAEGRWGALAAPALVAGLGLLVANRALPDAALLYPLAVLALTAACALAAGAAADGPLLLAAAVAAALAGLFMSAHEWPAFSPLLAGLGLGAIGLAGELKLRPRAASAGAAPDPISDPAEGPPPLPPPLPPRDGFDPVGLRPGGRGLPGLPPAWRGHLLTAGAVVLLVGGQLTAADLEPDGPPLAGALPVQLLLLGGLLAVGWVRRLPVIAILAAASAALVLLPMPLRGPRGAEVLTLAAALWAAQLGAAWWQLRRGAPDRLLPWAPALASGLFLLAARGALHDLGAAWLAGPAALLAAVALVPHLRLLLTAPGGLAAERSRVTVLAGAILALVTAAIPLQLEDEWITVGWALLVPALAWLHGRVGHRGLLWWMAGLAAAVAVRLVVNEAVLDYHPRSGTVVWNFWLYAYGVPALALLGAARLLRGRDDRLVPAVPPLGPLLGALGALLLFLLLNLEIADAFSAGDRVLLRLRGSLAYDLALTIGWACFAVGLLAAGIVQKARPVRVAAIVLLAVTVVKGFLLDLGRLEGLYRVASFVGLAISLALVAVILQKFVLADREGPP